MFTFGHAHQEPQQSKQPVNFRKRAQKAKERHGKHQQYQLFSAKPVC